MRQAKNRELTVLFVTHAFGAPAAAGNELRVLNLAKWFNKQGFRVHVAWKTHPSALKVDSAELDGIQVYPLWPYASSRNWATKEQKGLIRYEDEICPDWLVEQVESLEVMLQPDIVISEYIFMSRCLEGSRATLKLIDTHDVFSRRKALVEKFGIKESYYVPEKIEAKMLSRASALLAIQDQEAEILKGLVPKTDVVTCGVDFDAVLKKRPKKSKKTYSAIVVASDNPANRAGVKAFFQHCWPKIRKHNPRAGLLLVGGIGKAIGKVPTGVKVTGRVDDLASQYANCKIALNPVAAGTGLKIKTVEALAFGLPVVSFSGGVEGIRSSANGLALFKAEDWNEFADIVIELLADPTELKRAQGAARKFALKEFSSQTCYADLLSLLKNRFPTCEFSDVSPNKKKTERESPANSLLA